MRSWEIPIVPNPKVRKGDVLVVNDNKVEVVMVGLDSIVLRRSRWYRRAWNRLRVTIEDVARKVAAL